MPVTVSFAKEGLLAEQRCFGGFKKLIQVASKDKLPIVFDLSRKLVSAGDKAAIAEHGYVIVRGQRISPEINLSRLSLRGAICLPFLIVVRHIVLPTGYLATFGRPYRPLGDFFMRNYINAALRKRVRYETAHGDCARQSQDLRRCYVWMLRTQLSDAVLQAVDPADRLLKACHFDVDLGESPFFSRAALEFREQQIKQTDTRQNVPQLTQLLDLRSQIMARF